MARRGCDDANDDGDRVAMMTTTTMTMLMSMAIVRVIMVVAGRV